MNQKSLIGNLMLTLAALIWGCAFVAQSVGMDYVRPLTFNGIRSLLAGIVLLPVIFLFEKAQKKNGTYKKPTEEDRKLLFQAGLSCGFILFLASTVQQYGIAQTTVGKAGFIAVLYVLIVPFIGLLMKRHLPKRIWFCCFLALCGLYLLCMKDEIFSPNQGDIIVFISSVLYAFHILTVDHFASRVNGVKLSCIQFLVTGILSIPCMFLFDKPSAAAILSAWLPIFYAGALSGGIGFTLQIVAQKWTEPSVASLLMSLESVFAVLAGALFLRQIPTFQEIGGCVLMFLAILLIQLPEKEKSES